MLQTSHHSAVVFVLLNGILKLAFEPMSTPVELDAAHHPGRDDSPVRRQDCQPSGKSAIVCSSSRR